jgi:hypothetical protein
MDQGCAADPVGSAIKGDHAIVDAATGGSGHFAHFKKPIVSRVEPDITEGAIVGGAVASERFVDGKGETGTATNSAAPFGSSAVLEEIARQEEACGSVLEMKSVAVGCGFAAAEYTMTEGSICGEDLQVGESYGERSARARRKSMKGSFQLFKDIGRGF